MKAKQTWRVIVQAFAASVLPAVIGAQAQGMAEKELWIVSIKHLALAPGGAGSRVRCPAQDGNGSFLTEAPLGMGNHY